MKVSVIMCIIYKGLKNDFYSRFTVYIVIPMHPEGIPSDSAIQEMLFWQRNTMQMMYTR